MDHFFFLDAQQALEEEEDAQMLMNILLDEQYLNISNLSPSEMTSLVRLSERDISTLLDWHDDLHILGAEEYLSDLKNSFEQIPAPPKPKKWKKGRKGEKQRKKWEKKVREYEENYQVVQVAPSIIPAYFSGIRVFEYNVSALEGQQFARDTTNVERPNWKEWWAQMDREIAGEMGLERSTDHVDGQLTIQRSDVFNLDELDAEAEDFEAMRISRQQHSKAKDAKPKKPSPIHIPAGPHKSAPRGPLYESQLFSTTRWEVHFVNLTEVNALYKDNPKRSWDYGKDFFKLEYSSDAAPYEMKDLTMSTWLDLARKVGKEKKANNTELFAEIDDEDEFEDVELHYSESDEEDSDMEDARDETGRVRRITKKHKGKKDKKGRKSETYWDVFLRRAFINSGHAVDFDD
jgi:endopolyphosphatase